MKRLHNFETLGIPVVLLDRSRDKADAVDDVVALDEEGLAGLDVLDGDTVVLDLGHGGLEVGLECLYRQLRQPLPAAHARGGWRD